MKRMLALLLLLFTLVNFSACEKDSDSDNNYKYDMLSDRFINSYTLRSNQYRPFKGGCLIMTTPEIFSGGDVLFEKSGREWNIYVFDEETKVLYLPCFNASCPHDKIEECFSKKLFLGFMGYMYVGVKEDRIFRVEPGVDDHPLAIEYYSFDGTLEDRFVFDLRQLKNADGTDAVYPNVTEGYGAYGDKIYIDVAGYDIGYQLPDEGEETVEYNKWLVEFDLTTNEFRLIANYLVPDNYSYESEIYLIDDNRVILRHDYRIFYTFDLSEGKCVAQSDTCPDSSQISLAFSDFYYKGVGYGIYKRQGGDIIYRARAQGEKDITVSETFGNGAYVLGDLFAESENGLIYNYYENGKTADDDIYTVNENGRDVVYVKPKRLVYVEKADLADGTVDKPLFYDAELGMFK